MRRRSFVYYRRRRGVSEVIGALLLIIVVVAAVASLSVFLSQAETASQQRQSYINSVQDENLQFAYVQLSPSSPNVQWELDNSSARYYFSMVSSSQVLVSLQGGPGPAVLATLSMPYSAISKGALATYYDPIHPVAGLPVVTFSGAGMSAVQPASWSNVTITIRNLNTASSGLYQMKVGNNWLSGWEQVTQSGQVILPGLGPTSPALTIPARGTVTIYADLSGFTALAFPKNQSLSFGVLTSDGNLFSATYNQPVAVVKASTSSQDYGVTSRDVITLDGSESFSSSTSIQSYTWTVEVPTVSAGCSASSFSNPADYVSAYATGETIEYTPESLFASGLGTDCITGPILATLTVVDDNGFIGSSQSVLIPEDPNIAPSASIVSTGVPSCGGTPDTGMATIEVDNIFNQPAAGVAVVAFGSGTVSLTGSSEAVTDSGGQATFTYSCSTATPGVLEVISGTLPPLYLNVG